MKLLESLQGGVQVVSRLNWTEMDMSYTGPEGRSSKSKRVCVCLCFNVILLASM